MRIIGWLPALVLAMIPALSSGMDPEPVLADPVQQEIYERLTNEVRCLVCQNQTIADSSAPLAADLRREIREMVEAGESEAEIKTFLLDRYGDFVLYRPRLMPSTAMLWFAPVLLLLIGGFGLRRIIQRRATLPVPADEDDSPPAATPGD
ncbi:MAG: cytochrome c-type biogenesis protein CcmH [Gammaproteobacteria bacterium]|nr:cytochrome c-type biogenesis protein CcmH [Gammaproteobacteria bacterium]